ncbi:helix-turn-helix domain-containing protein [Bifidobacterium moukalabense]|nr:helix-turn-helix domain-containing protein [Bifidobacterium moukalabense]
MRRLYESRTVTVDQVAAMMGVGRSTIYRCLNQDSIKAD